LNKDCIIINPVAGKGAGAKAIPEIQAHLAALEIDYDLIMTQYPGHAIDLAEEAGSNGYTTVVAVGGDGTVNEVLNGIMNSAQKNRRLAVFPSGTADDFARNMGIPRGREEALNAILGDNEKTIDLMLVNDRYAAVTVGIGLDAEIAYRSYGSKHLRLMAYWYHGLSMLMESMPRSKLSIDVGGKHLDEEYLLAVAGNAGSYGRYMNMLPEAQMDDGEINLATFDLMNRFKALLLFGLSTMGGRHTWAREMNQYRGREIVIECMGDVYAQFDGEAVIFPQGEMLDMKVEPLAITVKVPESESKDK